MKRLLVLFLVVTMAAACGDDDDNATTNNTSPNATSPNATSPNATTPNNSVVFPDCPELGGAVAAGTELSGCYRVTSDVEATAGLVTIAPGTAFQFAADTGFLVADDGALDANGTAADPIVMIGATPESGFYRGLAISSQQPENSLQFVEIAHAGSDVWDPCCPEDTALAAFNAFEGAIVTIEDSSFSDSGDFGAAFTSDSDIRGFARNSFSGAASHSVRIYSSNVGALDTASTYGEGAVRVDTVDVSNEQSWAPIEATYEVFGTFDVLENGVVTIEPGATLAFSEDGGIEATDGILTAVGTEAARITFKGITETESWWRGLSWASLQPDNAIAFADIAHGGSDFWDPCCPQDTRESNLNVHDEGLLSVENVTSTTAPYGLSVNADSELTSFANNTFTDHGEASVAVSSLHLGSLDAASTYNDIVLVNHTTVEDDATWPAIDAPYEFITDADTTVTAGATVTIEPGAVLLFREQAGLQAADDGVLIADGTAAAPITFSGTTETAGWWHGLAFTSPGANSISNATVSYGGSDFWDPCCPQDSGKASINVFEGGNLSLSDSTVFGGEDFALFVGATGTLTANNNDYMGEPVSMP